MAASSNDPFPLEETSSEDFQEENASTDEYIHFLCLQPIIPIEYLNLPKEDILHFLQTKPLDDFFKLGLIVYEFIYNKTKQKWDSFLPLVEIYGLDNIQSYWQEYKHFYLKNFEYFYSNIKTDYLKEKHENMNKDLNQITSEMAILSRDIDKTRKKQKRLRNDYLQNVNTISILLFKNIELEKKIRNTTNKIREEKRHPGKHEVLNALKQELRSYSTELKNNQFTIEDNEMRKQQMERMNIVMAEKLVEYTELLYEMKQDKKSFEKEIADYEKKMHHHHMNKFIFKQSSSIDDMKTEIYTKIKMFLEDGKRNNIEVRIVFWNADIFLTPFNDFMTDGKNESLMLRYIYTGTGEYHRYFSTEWNFEPFRS